MSNHPLRVRSVTTFEKVRGYLDPDEVRIQYLQEKHWWGWKTLDQEIVPNHVRISMGCFGDTGGWISKFAEIGSFARDGIIHIKN